MNKEPFEMLEDIWHKVNSLNEHIILLEHNIKVLTARLGDEQREAPVKMRPVQVPTAPAVDGGPKITEVKHTSPPTPPPEAGFAQKSCAVSGKVQSEDGKLLHSIPIKIMNSEKKIIKETTSNRAGLWMAHLKPGKYIVKIMIGNRPAQYKMFEVDAKDTELEV